MKKGVKRSPQRGTISARVGGALLALLLLLLPACHEGTEALSRPEAVAGEEAPYLTFSFLLAPPSSSSSLRVAYYTLEEAGEFSEGDAIDLWGHSQEGSKHYRLERRGGEWLPRLRARDLGRGHCRITAIYPAREEATHEGFSYDLPLTQTAQNRAESDLLIASRSEDLEGLTHLEMGFRHAFSRIELKLSGSIPPHLQVAVRGQTHVEFSPSRGGFSAPTGPPQWISSLRGEWSLSREWGGSDAPGDSYFFYLLPHQELSPYRDEQEGWIRLSSASATHHYPAPLEVGGRPLETLQEGKELILSLSLQGQNDPYRDGTFWVKGVTPPRPEEWVTVRGKRYAPWHEGCGWYDCNKEDLIVRTDPSKSLNDLNFCWAATISNLIHWWMEHNSQQIARYGKYQGPTPTIYPTAPIRDTEHHASYIFELYRENFIDIGVSERVGLEWFFRGTPPSWVLLKPNHQSHGGFFSDLFLPHDRFFMARATPNVKALSEAIKEALRHDRAMGAQLLIDEVSGWHAVNVWGAEFDAEGIVTAIYMVDSNDGADYFSTANGAPRGKDSHASLIRRRILSVPSSPWGPLTAHYEALPGYTLPIHLISQIDLRQDLWERYFATHP